MVKFYVGEMSSHWVDLGCGQEEVHVLERLNCVLVAHNDSAADCLDEALRRGYQDFIRSDSSVRTLVDLNVFTGGVRWNT